MTTLEDYLSLYAGSRPDHTALVCGDKRLSYAQLASAVEQRARQWQQWGHRPVVFRSSQDEQFVIDYLAIHRAGAVAMPLEQGAPDALVDELSHRTEGEKLPDEVADVLCTTGTTGHAKAVMVSDSAIVATGDNLVQGQGFSEDTAFVVCGPLNHIGCLSKIYPTLMVGGTLVVVPNLKNLGLFLHLLQTAGRRTATFLVPASIRMLLALGAKSLAASKDRLDFIETGAAPLAQSDMQRLCKLLPATRLYNTYASTEAGVIATFDFHAGGCQEGCVGRPLPHSRVTVSAEGTLVCHGETLMSGYLGDPQRTAQVLHDGGLWTSDLGSIDAEGRIHLTGRAGDVINTGGYKVDPSEVESAAMAHSSVADCVCVAASHPLMGQVLKLLVVTRPGKDLDPKGLADFLKARLEPYKVPYIYNKVEKVNRTFNGKIDRKSYTA